MQPAAKLGDTIDHGGAIVSGSGNVMINDQPAAIVGGSTVTCALHASSAMASGSATVLINDKPAARMGDVAGCGAVVVSGSANVQIG